MLQSGMVDDTVPYHAAASISALQVQEVHATTRPMHESDFGAVLGRQVPPIPGSMVSLHRGVASLVVISCYGSLRYRPLSFPLRDSRCLSASVLIDES